MSAMRIDEAIGDRTAPADPLDLSEVTGGWINTDRGRSGGTLRYEVAARNGDLYVHGFGAGEDGAEFDWGEVEATALAPTVADTRAWAWNCRFDFGFASTEIAAYTKQGILIAASFNSFADGSGRADYWTREFFHRRGRR
jgi:hypothetical protein